MNLIILVGRTTKEIELRNTSTGRQVTNFTLAVDRRANKTTDFINCVAWGKTAELIARYVTKGKRIGVQGSLQVRKYEKDGQQREAVEVLVDNVEFLDDILHKEEPEDELPYEVPEAEPEKPARQEEPQQLPFEI